MASADRTIILNLLKGAVPERADELAELFEHVEIAPTGKGVRIEAEKDRITFGRELVDAVWLYAFSAWRAIETYSPAIALSAFTNISVDEALRHDSNLGPIEQEYRARISFAESFVASPKSAAASWPPDVPRPSADRASLDNQGAAAFDLALLALAAFFLHEQKHVQFARSPYRPSQLAEEEMACDVYARSFLTEKLAKYANAHGHDYAQVLSKRAFGLAVGSIVIHGMTPRYERFGNARYPSIGERMEALVGAMSLPGDAHFWLFASAVLTGVVRADGLPLDLVPTNYRGYTEALIGRLK
jgi:hypothetical protein